MASRVQPSLQLVTTVPTAWWLAGNSGLPGFWTLASTQPGPHTAITALVHGNEIAGALVLIRLLSLGITPLRGRLSLGFANLDAFARFDPANPTAVRWLVTPREGPQDESTTELVNRLRDDVLPPIEDGAGTQVLVTGLVAANVDMSAYMGERMPIFFGAVLTLSFLLLMLVFRSLLVPLKAVIMNLLSIGAAYGVIVAMFQWGWLSDLTGVQPGPIESWVPMMLFAVVFGLSMDYEVFLLSRIKEEYDRTGDNELSVARGLERTGRIVTAAAALIAVVFIAFATSQVTFIKLFGIGLTLAVLMDATIVRATLVPAFMKLAGTANWWAPRPLRQLYDRWGLGESAAEAALVDLRHETSDPEPEPDLEPAGAGPVTTGDRP